MASGDDEATRAGVALRYASAADACRDRLADVGRGLLVRTPLRVAVGERLPVTLALEKERVTIHAVGEVRCATPLMNGALAGLALDPVTHRDGVQLDLLFGIRTAGPAPTRPGSATSAGPASGDRPLSVAVLLADPDQRDALGGALSRFERERGPRSVSAAWTETPRAFFDALSDEPRGLAIVDCDPLGPVAGAIVANIRRHAPWARLPVILLSSDARSPLEDRRAVFLRKPFEEEAFVALSEILTAARG